MKRYYIAYYYAKLKLAEESGDPSLGPPDFITKRVLEGNLGVKSGKGFYDYTKTNSTVKSLHHFFI